MWAIWGQYIAPCTNILSQAFLGTLTIRAINNELIDTYQLKSLDGLFGNTCIVLIPLVILVLCVESELGLDNQAIVKEGDKLLLMLNPQFSDIDQETLNKLRKLFVELLHQDL